MKLYLENFKGKTPQGDNYRITGTKSTYNKTICEYRLDLEVITQYQDKTWFANSELSDSAYYLSKEDYKECLKGLLLKLEVKLQTQLLKSTMQLAV